MLCRSLAVLFLLASTVAARAVPASEIVPVQSRQISQFRVGSDETVFGRLEFIGGIEMTSPNPLLGAISAIRFRPDGDSFVAVMDTGHWVEGAVIRDDAGRLAGLTDLKATSMTDGSGRAQLEKWRVDSEGLALREGQAIASFEQLSRIEVYPDPGFAHSRPIAQMRLPFPLEELRSNGGLETIAIAPKEGPLAGAAVVVSERSVDEAGNLLAGILEGPMKGAFTVAREDPYSVTDGAFLPNGDLLLLERRFNLASGLGMRIRRIAAEDIRPGAVVNGEVLLQADMAYQIDNMEGLDVIARSDGDIRVIVVSDDNHSILERNLMLEFRLAK
ncbi:esterase-like activity of phytase family protein [Sinorhizobium numidicum]|uniref:Esterase-like activity of phytase family protein n=1 Tax=Sinorhizobium numidicum TaxID=680248 RepID=A0ABY8D017_9HYPH|nr:esterase-like activity of phytase family protein [Sinorhizobium numidicum]WEX76826.1 esterase-like activity of phytase family protein [Sinorhizobium numidicum]WEX83487.1 esterase-like activity of phytase family protein [Sinorhizobium numidicum]